MGESKPVVVRSAANAKIRHLTRMRDNRARRKAGRILVDGWRETRRAINAGLKLCQICVAEMTEWPDELERSDLAEDTILVVSQSLLEKVSYGQSAREVVAEFVRPELGLDQLRLPTVPLILVLDHIEKPGNVGAILRCADAVGVDAVLLCESADPYNPNAIRNSAGSVFHIPMAVGTETELSQFLTQRGIRPIAARVESSDPLWLTDLCGPLAIILGSESAGLGARWQAPIASVRIPMQGQGDSLNVSVSAAVICYEAARQRQPASANE